MMRFILCSVLILLLLDSCKKTIQISTGSGQSLIGGWKWVQQTDAIAIFGTPYDTLTPQNTGTTELLAMDADSTWILFKNGIKVNEGIFKFIEAATPDGLISTLDFFNNGKDSIVNHSLSNDTLYTSNIFYAGKYTVNIYVRN